MTKLSEKKGGGLIYSPAMMKGDGSTGYYHKAFTSAGNKVTTVLRFKRPAFTGGGVECMSFCHATPAHRASIYIFADDYADTDRAGTVQVQTKNSGNTDICLLFSPVGYLDGQEHTLLYSFDGDNGLATFVIDGEDADDTGNADRVAPTTGTLQAGASTNFTVCGGNGTVYSQAEIGFAGHHEVYIASWQDFMDQYGNPKVLDESTWAEWTSQPKFWNKHGDMVNNLGSAGAMTKNGTINVGDGGSGPFPMIGLPTIGTAVAADIAAGETAWVNGVEVVGTA